MTIGDKLKPFNAKDQNGNTIEINLLVKNKPFVVYFYPKNFTSGCTKEACEFRDRNDEFQNLGAEVIGISGDSEQSHDRFARKYNLPFTLLSDREGKIRKLFGVKKNLLGLIPGRETFVFDDTGKLAFRYNSMDATSHIRKALKIVREISELKN